jgi:hypothetical protein
MPKNKNSKFHNTITIFCAVAALLYSSWILSLWLNPIVFKSGVASELAVSGQPYASLFVAGDVIAGALILAIVFLILRRQVNKHKSSIHFVALIGFAIFGLFTAFAAIARLECAPSVVECGTSAGIGLFQLHDLLGLVAALGMTITFTNCASLMSSAWSKLLIIGLFFVWASSGMLALVDLSEPYLGSFLTQKVFLSINALLIFGFPYWISRKSSLN